MKNLKLMLAMGVAATMFTACGSDSSSSNSDELPTQVEKFSDTGDVDCNAERACAKLFVVEMNDTLQCNGTTNNWDTMLLGKPIVECSSEEPLVGSSASEGEVSSSSQVGEVLFACEQVSELTINGIQNASKSCFEVSDASLLDSARVSCVSMDADFIKVTSTEVASCPTGSTVVCPKSSGSTLYLYDENADCFEAIAY